MFFLSSYWPFETLWLEILRKPKHDHGKKPYEASKGCRLENVEAESLLKVLHGYWVIWLVDVVGARMGGGDMRREGRVVKEGYVM